MFFTHIFWISQKRKKRPSLVYIYEKFHQTWSINSHNSLTNTKIAEEVTRSGWIFSSFFSLNTTFIPNFIEIGQELGIKDIQTLFCSCFFIKDYAHTKFHQNWSRIKHSSHTKVRKFTKFTEIKTRSCSAIFSARYRFWF